MGKMKKNMIKIRKIAYIIFLLISVGNLGYSEINNENTVINENNIINDKNIIKESQEKKIRMFRLKMSRLKKWKRLEKNRQRILISQLKITKINI